MCPYQRSMFTNNVFDFVDIVLFCKDIITHSIKKIKLEFIYDGLHAAINLSDYKGP